MNLQLRIDHHEEAQKALDAEKRAILAEIERRVLEWFRIIKGDPAVVNSAILRTIEHLDDPLYHQPRVINWRLRQNRTTFNVDIDNVNDGREITLDLEPWVILGNEEMFAIKRAEADQRKAEHAIKMEEAKRQREIERETTRLRMISEAAEKLDYTTRLRMISEAAEKLGYRLVAL